MMRKKLLIFGYTLDMGGAEKALVDTINFLNDKCTIDLYLLEKKGVLLKNIPHNVNVYQLKNNIFSYLFFRFIPYFRKKKINKIASLKKYDAIIGYMEGRCGTWVADVKTDAKKIAWIHNDVSKFNIGIKDKEIIDTYNKVDKIVCVSKQVKKSFISKYPVSEKKVEVIYNLIAEEEIIAKSKTEKISKKKFTFVNVAKMRPQKRHDRLLRAAKILKEQGYDFEIWLVGNGPLENEIKSLINEYDLNNYVKMLSLKPNPYPYIKAADYFVLASDFEGYPISLLESLLLKTKIITTDVAGAKEMLKNNKYGFIVDVSTTALAQKMAEVMDDDKQSKILDNNLKNYHGDNEVIKKQLLDILNL